MIDAGVVEGTIALPAGLFADTGIPVSLWLLRRAKSGEHAPAEVLFIDAASMGTADERAQRVLREDDREDRPGVPRLARLPPLGDFGHSAGFARSAAIEEIRQNDYDLQPRRYVREQTGFRDSLVAAPSAGLEALQLQLDELTERAKRARRDIDTRLKMLHDSSAGEWSEVPLGRICDIQAGPGKVERERGLNVQGWTPLVLPRNIRRSHLSHNELDTVRPEISAKLVNYRIRPGDILCARSGMLGRHALVREVEGGWILGPSCMRLRPAEDEVVPEYLVHYLNSPEVHRWITSESRGSTAIPAHQRGHTARTGNTAAISRNVAGHRRHDGFDRHPLPAAPAGQHLEAFFACLYYAALRPSEAVMLREGDLHLPKKGCGGSTWPPRCPARARPGPTTAPLGRNAA